MATGELTATGLKVGLTATGIKATNPLTGKLGGV